MPQLEKASLTIIAASSNPSPSGGKTINFQFNPKEYTITKTGGWERTDSQSAKEAGPVQWKGPGAKSMTIDIYLDRSDSDTANVLKDTDLLFSCCAPTEKSTATGKPSGPFVLFGWGKQMSFTAIVMTVSVQFLMFRPSGEPYRAKASVGLEEVDVRTPAQNPTSGGLPARRTHILVDGETLAHVAQREYRDPNAWRVLAEANGIDDPLRVPAGFALLIPAPGEGNRPGAILDPVAAVDAWLPTGSKELASSGLPAGSGRVG